MTIPKIAATLFFISFLNLLGAPRAGAVRPLYGSFAVVAGSQFTSGFRDGSFNTARFNQPLGLSVSDDGNRLFVADSLNNRIRIIHLDQNNEVTTLAGQSAEGKLDGPLATALFKEPRGVLYLPGDVLVVNDFGNKSLRLIDLKAGKVTTYGGGPVDGPGAANATAKPVLLNGIKDMAYLAADHLILFTQPDAGVLNILNMATGKITTILEKNDQVPHPSALWIEENKIFVADRDLKIVLSMTWENKTVTDIAPLGMTPQDHVISLCESDGVLYSLLGQPGTPAQRFFLDKKWEKVGNANNGMVSLTNAWGDTIPPDKYYGVYLNGTPPPPSPWVGFVPDPSGKRKFFYTVPDVNIICSIRDLFGGGDYNTHNLFGPEYPVEKPKNTYRILMVGDCRTTDCKPFPFPSESHATLQPEGVPYFPQQLGLTFQIERELNFQAALDNNPLNYEVLNFGRHGDLVFWPSIDVPAVAKLYDIDLLIVFSPTLDDNVFDYYFNHNLTEDGIPQYPPDMEYVLKPPLERIPEGLPRNFYDYCKEHNLVQLKGRNLVFDEGVYKDPKLQDMIQEFGGKPWAVLNQKLSAMKTSSGQPVKMLVLFSYTGSLSDEKYQTDFYKKIAQKFNIPNFDLNPWMNALHLSYYPVTYDGSHFNPDGDKFFAKLLAHVLPQEKLIPWPINTTQKDQR